MINNVVLVSRLTKDIDLRYTSSGAAVATFLGGEIVPVKEEK